MGGVPYNLSAPLTRVDSILCKGSIKSCSKLQIKMLCKQERIPYLHIGAHCPTLSCGSGTYAALEDLDDEIAMHGELLLCQIYNLLCSCFALPLLKVHGLNFTLRCAVYSLETGYDISPLIVIR